MIEVMERLRRDCPWDREQTHESLVTYLIEETYELIEAIETKNSVDLQEELGDVLLQVLFHAQIASESEGFNIQDVAQKLREKLVNRHPHVFGDGEAKTSEEVKQNWEQIKAAEKGRTSPIDGVPIGQPALSLAAKVLHREQKISGKKVLADSISEEELAAALFNLVSRAHVSGIDPEGALRRWVRSYIQESKI